MSIINSVEVKTVFAVAEWTKPKASKEVIFKCREREALYDSCDWSLQFIPIEKLYIGWSMGMGFRKWAKGDVIQIAKKFTHIKHKNDPLWAYANELIIKEKGCLGQIVAGIFPVIVIKRGKRYEIDDGCHRVMAQILANAKVIQAYVGVPRK